MEGKFIAIEGPEGSGKELKSELLVKRLFNEGYKVKYFDFPQYETSFFGKLAGKMLKGEYGPIENIDPHLACLPLALDRMQASPEIKKTVREGKIAIANRFTLSNVVHQGARLPRDQRETYFKFIWDLENKILEIPIPNLYIYLNVPREISEKLILKKMQRKYLEGGKVDELEKDGIHQTEALGLYRELSNVLPNVARINCCNEEGELLTKEEIHEKVWIATERSIFQEGQSLNPERHS